MHPIVNIAIRAARAGGTHITRSLERLDSIEVEKKSNNDFVSIVDRQAEQEIINTIHESYPNHSILAEESGTSGTSDYQWVIDPLDGTTNFLHGFPQFSVSIAVKHKGRLEHGVIYDPLRQEIFSATRGAGAQLNDRRIRVSNLKSLDGALLGTGFPYKSQENIDIYLATLKALLSKTSGIRRPGSAALDLAYVAAARLDGFWEFNLREWDIAAGALIIQESGGMVSDTQGGENYLSTGNIVAGNPKVFKEILRTIHPYIQPLQQQGGRLHA